MAIDPRHMPPAKLCQLLNSNPLLGEAVTLGRLRKHRLAAGFRISGDGETIDFLRYVAWLVARRHIPAAAEVPAPLAEHPLIAEARAATERLRAHLAEEADARKKTS